VTQVTSGRFGGLEPATQLTLVDSALGAMRSAILTGRILPGERLVEAELARELGTSRGPIREALVLLSKEGLVVNVPRGGKYVQGFTPRLVNEVYSLRGVIEPYAAARAIARLGESASARLQAALGDIATAASAGDAHLLASHDIAFHDLIFEFADHDLLKRAWHENIAGKLRILLNVTTLTLSTLGDAERQHTRILETLLAGKEQETRTRLERHIEEARKRALRALVDGASPANSAEKKT
jgi:DNA-binding GntR family transcriptional regulator